MPLRRWITAAIVAASKPRPALPFARPAPATTFAGAPGNSADPPSRRDARSTG